MNAGLVEQKGTPLDVYERPHTLFVAKFLGSPQMNLVDAKLARRDGRWIAEGDDLSLAVDEERFGRDLGEGKKVIVGVRPHDLVVGAEGGAELKVELVEALGFEAYAHGWIRAAGPRIVVRLEGARVKVGDTLRLGADPAKVHLFDPQTERALGAPPPPREG
jgi:sn-glycerol 3-phosphate transport system ATP-binding protein/multiple sugar transport system ATP-binding protein